MTLAPIKQPNFDRIARPYRILEYLTLGPTLQRCRTHFLPQLLQQKQALVLGDGDGRFLAKLLTASPRLHADAVDTSATMLQLLNHRCRHTTRLRTHTLSALSYNPSNSCDLVVAHFFLDCLTQTQVDQLISALAIKVQPDTLWLISDFRIPTGPMRLPARIFVGALYLAFRILTGLRITQLPDYITPLTNAGLTRIAYHYSLAGLLTTELWISTKSKIEPNSDADPNPNPDPNPDPIPNPEPAVPSLDKPDPGVFHHTPSQPPQ